MALARMLCVSGHEVTVWSALEREVEEYGASRRHPNLPGMIIPDEIHFTKMVGEACEGKDIILFAVPSVFVRSTAKTACPFIPDGQLIVDVAKGIEPDTLFTLTQVIGDELKKDGKHDNVRLVALSGPTHAEEVALDLPTTIVASCEDKEAAACVQKVFMNDVMRVYTNDDVLGVELCGAMKNIIALASGIALGLGYGDNTKAALITRGMYEITRLGRAMGCDDHTFYGLAGIGDLIVTCASKHSRNRRAGVLIGQGMSYQEAMDSVKMVVEGVYSAKAALQLARKKGVTMPIVEMVNRILFEDFPVGEALTALLKRDKKSEISGISWDDE